MESGSTVSDNAVQLWYTVSRCIGPVSKPHIDLTVGLGTDELGGLELLLTQASQVLEL